MTTESLNPMGTDPLAGKRSSGILLHPTSLPGAFGVGDLGPATHDWVEFLAESETAIWQTLPLGPTGFGDSPYQSFSSFAGNPLLISPELLAIDGLSSSSDATERPPTDRVDFAAAKSAKASVLSSVFTRFTLGAGAHLRAKFDDFREGNRSWLDDFALFMALKDQRGGVAWTDWPLPLRERNPNAVDEATMALADAIEFHRFTQFIFFRQWTEVRRHAERRGVTIIGDLPIYVAADSVDVWVAPDLFDLDVNGRPAAVAGVPPDSFSDTGQLWGNPLYDWNAHARENFSWWTERLRAAIDQSDIVRIDHFRAFADFWEVPPQAETAEIGRWRDGPGAPLFEAVSARLGRLPLIAEDLGDLSAKVPELRDALGLPGMRLVQDAFKGDPEHSFLPHRYPVHCVAYTGTHDNNTAIGWFESAAADERAFARSYLDWNGLDPAWTLITAAWESRAMLAIAPLQDFLRLDNRARMNTPATTEGNWQWRAADDVLTDDLAGEIRDLNRRTKRASRTRDFRPQTTHS